MRLEDDVIESIVQLVKRHFHNDADVYLFGSRVDDTKYGGDIDLYIESCSVRYPVKSKIAFKLALYEVIGEQKIDVVFHDKNLPLQPIHEIALSEGIKLN